MTQVYLTFRALEDLQEIYDYSLEKWGEKVSLNYMRKLEDALKLLENQPNLLRINPAVSSRFVLFPVEQHYLICDCWGMDIVVLTVKHVSMNLLDRLKDLEPTLEAEARALYQRIADSR